MVHEDLSGIGEVNYLHNAVTVSVPGTHVVNQKIVAVLGIKWPQAAHQRPASRQQANRGSKTKSESDTADKTHGILVTCTVTTGKNQAMETFNIGADELPFVVWKNSPICDDYINNSSDINSYQDLYDSSVKRINKTIVSNGARMAGWEDILLIHSEKSQSEIDINKNLTFHNYIVMNKDLISKIKIHLSHHCDFDTKKHPLIF